METPNPMTPARRLTRREFDIVRELLTGASNKEIAFRLGLVEGTIKVYFKKLADKLDIRSRVGMALWGERSGMFPRPTELFTSSPPVPNTTFLPPEGAAGYLPASQIQNW
jgi:DNA-binding CsgD family transcriptional regulator